jgi:hypothetical protein
MPATTEDLCIPAIKYEHRQVLEEITTRLEPVAAVLKEEGALGKGVSAKRYHALPFGVPAFPGDPCDSAV